MITAKPGAQDEVSMEVDEDQARVSERGDADAASPWQPHGSQQEVEMDVDDDTEFDVAAIIKNCVHSAASMLEDSEIDTTSSPRKTSRVQLLLQLLERKDKGI